MVAPHARRIPEATVARLPVYQRILIELVRAGTRTVSSDQLADMARVNASKVRKDLSFLGSFGTRGLGLRGAVPSGADRPGAGPRRGLARGHRGARQPGPGPRQLPGVHLPGVPGVRAVRRRAGRCSGMRSTGVTVHHVDEFERVAESDPPSIGVIATPASAAQDVADRMVRAGVGSILNFAPRVLTVPSEVLLRYVDLSIELQVMSFYLSHRDVARGPGVVAAPARRGPQLVRPHAERRGLGPGAWAPPPLWHSPPSTGILVGREGARGGRPPLRVVRPGQGALRDMCRSSSLDSSSIRCPLDVLERVAISEDDLGKVVASLRDRPNLSEVVVLSTCMRTELYAVVDRFHEGVTDLQEFLAAMADMPVEELEDPGRSSSTTTVTAHLFEVAAGLRSSVLGETEVLGQVRRALERAEAERAAAPVLSGLFQPRRPGRPPRAARHRHRPRHDLAVARGRGAGRRPHGRVTGRTQRARGGGGRDGRGRHHRPRGARPGPTWWWPTAPAPGPRSWPPAWGATGVGLGRPARRPRRRRCGARVARDRRCRCSAPSSSTPAGAHRVDRPLVLVDLGVPRNVDPAVRAVPGVELLDMDDLTAHAERAMAGRRAELTAAQAIVGARGRALPRRGAGPGRRPRRGRPAGAGRGAPGGRARAPPAPAGRPRRPAAGRGRAPWCATCWPRCCTTRPWR